MKKILIAFMVTMLSCQTAVVNNTTRNDNEIIDKLSRYINTYSKTQQLNERTSSNDSAKRSTLTYSIQSSKFETDKTQSLRKDINVNLEIATSGDVTSYSIEIVVTMTNLTNGDFVKETFATKARHEKDIIDYVKATLEVN